MNSMVSIRSSPYNTLLIFSLVDDAHAARRKYKKDLDLLNPDLEAYNRQKALATGGALTTFDAAGGLSAVQVSLLLAIYGLYTILMVFQAMGSVEQRLAHENLYRDSSTLIYGDSKPSEEAIDRVVSKVNTEYVLPVFNDFI
jgi:pre-mRNA-splicing factor SYF2